ncbi:hypothetical protein [Streptomyces sp. NPDC017638]|uniref:hypothetical protein n=1 Tax=Streptomyces sp. NPDC017638 TaxID=3365004 RepID=UPI0037A2578F
MRLIVDSYELPDRQHLVSTILWWQERCWRGIESQADAGDVAMARLRVAGAARRMAYQWVSDHRDALEHAVR